MIARIVAGDLEALGEVFEEHADRVHRLAFGITKSLSDAEDVVQDVFVALPEQLAAFKGRASLTTWLHRVAVRTAMLRLRRERFLDTVPLEWASRQSMGDRSRSVERVDLERALNLIPDEYRVVIWLKVVEGWSHAEIAETLGIAENTSYQRLHRARRMLRGKLKDE